jgi:hypothetical protein
MSSGSFFHMFFLLHEFALIILIPLNLVIMVFCAMINVLGRFGVMFTLFCHNAPLTVGCLNLLNCLREVSTRNYKGLCFDQRAWLALSRLALLAAIAADMSLSTLMAISNVTSTEGPFAS